MKTPLYAAAVAALLAGYAVAGDQPRSDAMRDEMRADKDGDGVVSAARAQRETAAGSNA